MASTTATISGVVRVRGGAGKGPRGRAFRSAKRASAEERAQKIKARRAHRAWLCENGERKGFQRDRASLMLAGVQSDGPIRYTPVKNTHRDPRVAVLLAAVPPRGYPMAKGRFREARDMLVRIGWDVEDATRLIREYQDRRAQERAAA